MTEERFTSRSEKTCTVLELKGRMIENDSYDDLVVYVENQLAQGNRKFIIDLGGLRLINSSGINLLVGLIKKINDHSAQVVFTRVPEKVSELLNIIRLNAVLSVQNSIDDGIQFLN